MRLLRCIIGLLLLVAVTASAHHVMEEDGCYKVSHEWTYGEIEWSCSLSVPTDLYAYYQQRTHGGDEYVHYVLSDYDRYYIRDLVRSFRSGGEDLGYSDTDNVLNVIAFVQSLQYVYDAVSKGEDDYVRFPLETLVDGVGDCEDMSILAAAILYEMGYGVLLACLPEHLALAVRCDDSFSGTYYDYEGSRYYYLEMTNTGWDIGQIPDRFKGTNARLIPVEYRNHIRIENGGYHYDSYYMSDLTVNFTMDLTVMNVGPGNPEELWLHAMIKPDASSDKVLFDRRFGLQVLEEGRRMTYQVHMSVPRPIKGVLELRIEGDNFDSSSLVIQEVDVK